jgi:nitrogen-specific signal transduction histidine kinase
MAVQVPYVSVLMFGATGLILAAAAVARRHDSVPGSRAFVVFMSCAALWAVTYGIQLLSGDLDAQLFWTNFQYPAGLFTCVTFGVFVLRYTGRDHRLTRGRLAAASALPVLTSVAVWVPGYRWLVHREATLVAVDSFLVADITHGPLFDVAVVYSYLVVLGSLGLLGLTALRTRQLYQKQTALITVAAFVPLVGGAVAYVLDITVIDYTPVGLAAFGVGVAVALSRYQLLDVYPVPRNRIIDQIATGVVVTDASDRIVDINPAASAIVGGTDVIGRELDALGDTAAAMAAMDPGTTAEVTVDDHTYFECTKSTLATEGGFGDTHFYILTDVTERRQRQQSLEAKNDRLDSFAEVISHDLRNPLSVAHGRAEVARAEPAPEHFDRIDAAHARMAEIIDDMLTLARSGDPVDAPDVVDIETVARDVWENVTTRDAQLTVEGTRELRADPQRLKQLFENLFRNSVEHGSTVADPSVRVRVGTTASGFFVADDGPGIPVDEREAVFRSGVSSGSDGTGIGLAIVQSVVDGHDWAIDVSESEDGGARFDVET